MVETLSSGYISTGSDHPTQKHYNQRVEFFTSFLDPYLKYSSGLWVEYHDSFESAALNMLDKIIDFIPYLGDSRILEIGPGWGSFIRRCKERNGGCLPSGYVCLNPSAVQNQFLREMHGQDLDIRVATFEDVPLQDMAEQFDVILALGSFCHLTNLDHVMRKLYHCLRDRGKIIIEDTMYLSETKYKKLNDHPQTRFIQQDVFGVAPIPSFPNFLEISAAANIGIEYVLEHSDSYFKTITHWIERLTHYAAHGDPDFHESAIKNIRYMELAQRGWGYTIGNYLLVMRKNRQKPRFVRSRK